MNEELSGIYYSSICGAENETSIDPCAGVRQTYVEDCAVCCRPQVLKILIDKENGFVTVEAGLEG